ncbi:MAG: Nickel transporter UreH [Labilithrix sp.]|nr:Nickel transporter UreH [Labilithrix sp.]
MLVTATACLLGFANGMRHALEPDHLAAVSTLVAGQRSAKASVRYAAAWGAGHAAMLVVAGGALALLRTELPDAASDALELVVAVVLIGLGVRGLAQAARSGRSGGATFTHEHGEVAHEHAGVRDHVHVSKWTLARLPFVVGLVHGLAGSGALAALVASHVASPAFALAFIAIYAIGAAVGMATLAGVLGWPLARIARAPRFVPVLVGVSAAASLIVGIAWAAPIVARICA